MNNNELYNFSADAEPVASHARGYGFGHLFRAGLATARVLTPPTPRILLEGPMRDELGREAVLRMYCGIYSGATGKKELRENPDAKRVQQYIRNTAMCVQCASSQLDPTPKRVQQYIRNTAMCA